MQIAEFRKKSDEDLRAELTKLRKDLFGIRAKKVTDVIEKFTVIRETRRDIARVLTLLRERQAPKPEAPKKKS